MRSSLTLSRGPINERRLALLFGIAVGLHGIIDPILTFYFGEVIATGYEVNPFIRWGISTGWFSFIGIHVLLVVESSLLFGGFLYLIRRADSPTDKRLAIMFKFGCVGLIVWGIGLIAWNVAIGFA